MSAQPLSQAKQLTFMQLSELFQKGMPISIHLYLCTALKACVYFLSEHHFAPTPQ
jgi:hypothetical protein